MKVLFIIDGLISGGKERRLTELMKMLGIRQDIEFELVVMNSEIHYKEVVDLKIHIHYFIRNKKKDISVLYKLYKLCKNYKPDIIHCWDSMTAIYSVPICKILHIKLVNGMVVDSPRKRNILNKQWFRAQLTFPFSDLVIGNSKAGLKAYNAPVKKSIAIYNGFNFKRIESIEPVEIIRQQLKIKSKFVIGMVASFSEFKDYKTFFKSAQLLLRRRNDITFLAIGNKTNSVLSEVMIETNTKQHFRLLGEVNNVESYINIMDICVLSTFTEGISNSILEYMAMEKPVIATLGGGTNEIIVDNETGLFINPSEPEELARKMEILLADEKMCLKFGRAGKLRIKEKFSIDNMINEYINVYYSVLKKHQNY